MSNSPSLAGRLLRIAVAGFLLAGAVTGPMLHAADEHPGAGWVPPDHAATSFHHDHAACVQLQSSTARPAPPPAEPGALARVAPRPTPRSATAGDRAWRSRPSARSPPSRGSA